MTSNSMDLGVLGVIPARLASTRLPRKPLHPINGRPLIQHVWERASAAKTLDKLVIATDSDEILKAAQSFGASVVMTSPDCSTGSERVYDAARLAADEVSFSCQQDGGEKNWRAVVNIQGDMPFIDPTAIDDLVKYFDKERERFDMATIALPLRDRDSFYSRTVVKVVATETGQAVCFSRAPVPFPRDAEDEGKYKISGMSAPCFGLKHVGLYIYGSNGLREYGSLAQTPLEKIEKLEQLRVLERGGAIGVLVLEDGRMSESIEIDTPDDVMRAEAFLRVLKDKR